MTEPKFIIIKNIDRGLIKNLDAAFMCGDMEAIEHCLEEIKIATQNAVEESKHGT